MLWVPLTAFLVLISLLSCYRLMSAASCPFCWECCMGASWMLKADCPDISLWWDDVTIPFSWKCTDVV